MSNKHEAKTKVTKTERKKAQTEEDTVFERLIKAYTKARKWDFVEDLFYAYGEVLEDREEKVMA